VYVYTDTQFNLMRIYLNFLMNIDAKQKGILLYFRKSGNTMFYLILVKKDF